MAGSLLDLKLDIRQALLIDIFSHSGVYDNREFGAVTNDKRKWPPEKRYFAIPSVSVSTEAEIQKFVAETLLIAAGKTKDIAERPTLIRGLLFKALKNRQPHSVIMNLKNVAEILRPVE